MKSFKTKTGLELPLLSLKNKDYLEVAYRILWFRTENPMGRIESEPIEMEDTHTVFKAVVSIPNEEGHYVKIGDGYKREDAKHFPDHLEKASTGAIGRALALCGYGTQFAPDLDEQHRIVDSPLEAAKGKGGAHGGNADSKSNLSQPNAKSTASNAPISNLNVPFVSLKPGEAIGREGVGHLLAVCAAAGHSEETVRGWVSKKYGQPSLTLVTKEQAQEIYRFATK